MAEPTKADLAGALREQLAAVVRDFYTFRELAEFRLASGENDRVARVKADEAIQARFTEILTRIAGIEAQLKALEKTADRNWQGWLALIGAGVAIIVAVLRK